MTTAKRMRTATMPERPVAGHLTQSLAYWVSVPVLLQLLYHFPTCTVHQLVQQ